MPSTRCSARLAPNAATLTREEAALRRGLAAVTAEHPPLVNLDLTENTARERLELLSLDQVDLHSIETFITTTYDLALLENIDKERMAQLAINTAVVFDRVGAGAYVLKHFTATCKDLYAIHNVFTQFTAERVKSRDRIPIIQNLFDICRAPHHTVLKLEFVAQELSDRLTPLQQRWTISHFVERASDPGHDAIITAFIFIELMPAERPLIDLLIRWITSGKLGFERGVVHLGDACIYFRMVNAADEESRQALEPAPSEEFLAIILRWAGSRQNLSGAAGVRENSHRGKA